MSRSGLQTVTTYLVDLIAIVCLLDPLVSSESFVDCHILFQLALSDSRALNAALAINDIPGSYSSNINGHDE